MDNGVSRAQVTNELMLTNGYPLEQATQLVRRAVARRKQERRRDGQKNFAGGMRLVMLGCLITLGSWHWAGLGSTYLVSSGLFGIGGLCAFQGMYQTLRNANSVLEYARCFAALTVCMAFAGAAMAYALGTTVLATAQ